MKASIALLAAALCAAMVHSHARAEDITGKVVETMDSGGYTYMRLKTPMGKRWAVVTQTPTTKAEVKRGATVTVVQTKDMQDFVSNTLKRKFDHIAFGLYGGAGPRAAAAPSAASASSAPDAAGASRGDQAAAGPIAKAPGPDGRTIAEIHAQKKALAGKMVVVRGKIVKLNAHILDRNWAHLNDGTGDAKDGSDDLMVILKDEAGLDQIVTVRGAVVLDKDLDGMFQFPVALEDAALVK